MKSKHLCIVLVATFLIGCAQAQAESPTSTPLPAATANAADSNASENLIRIDEQGAVVVEVTPINLNSPGDTIDFDVAMNTHSVDLSMDLTGLATLTTGAGRTVQASTWTGGQGGHHVRGTLSFPASLDGKPLLEDVTTLTLTIRDVDAPERTFEWSLNP